MKIASIADVKARLSAYIKDSARGPVVITKNGKPIAVLLAPGDEDELERLVLAHSTQLRSILDAARERIRKGAGVRHEDFWAAVDQQAKSSPQAAGTRKSPSKPAARSRRSASHRS
jgi:prevent-host-death family protein